eukprot:gene14242-42066_t
MISLSPAPGLALSPPSGELRAVVEASAAAGSDDSTMRNCGGGLDALQELPEVRQFFTQREALADVLQSQGGYDLTHDRLAVVFDRFSVCDSGVIEGQELLG